LKVIDEIKEYLANKKVTFKQENLSYAEMYSQEISISTTYNAFLNGFRDTSILILIIVTIFLGLRGSLAVAITFPFVYLLTFIITKSIGYTFNTIVSASLNLSLGIMVDNLIVMAQ
jgi:multidrug efflux pump subunit AcrB